MMEMYEFGMDVRGKPIKFESRIDHDQGGKKRGLLA